MTEATPEAPAAPTETTPEQQGNPGDEALKDAGKQALDRMKADKRAAEKRAAELEARLKEFEDRDKTESQKLAERAETTEARAREAEARALRLEVAFEKGLTPGQAKRLVGSTREELEADADEVLRDFPAKPAEPQVPGLDLGPRTTTLTNGADPHTRDLAQIKADIAASQRRST